MAMMSAEASGFLKLSVKELRRQAALRNVPLTHISAALEKADLVALILRAPPVLDQYGISGVHAGGKVWNADSIVVEEARPKRKKKKKRYSSSSSSSSSRSRKGKKKKKRKRRRSTSPAARIATPLEASVLAAMGRKEGGGTPALMTSSNTISGAPPMNTSQGTTVRAIMADVPDAPLDLRAPPSARRGIEPSLGEAGMNAAAALGFDVLPKAPSSSLPPAPVGGASTHLRPSVAPPLPGGSGSSGAFNALPARICIEYLCKASCALGANCPEQHIQDPEEEMRVRARFKLQECSFGAHCTRASCLYRHPGEKQEEANLGDSVSQGIVLRPGSDGVRMHLA